jgi:hypothetical protein
MKLMLLVIGALSLAAFNQPSAPPKSVGSALLTAKLTALNGTSRAVVLDGVGCSVSICSRVFIRGKSQDGSQEQILLDTIASIRDGKVFLLKNGGERHLSLVPDFRFLYFTDPDGGTEKIDLAEVRSVEFVGRAGVQGLDQESAP